MNRIYIRIWNLAKPYYRKGRPMDIDHIEWMMRDASIVCRKEHLDDSLLLPLVILHDVGYAEVPKGNPFKLSLRKAHMAAGAKIARRILEKVKYPEQKIKKIEYFISVHDNWAFGDNRVYKKDKVLGAFHDLDFIWMATPKGFLALMKVLKKNKQEMLGYLEKEKKPNSGRFYTKTTKALYEKYLDERRSDIPQKPAKLQFELGRYTETKINHGRKELRRLLRNPQYKRLYLRCKRHYNSVNDIAHDWMHISFVLELSLSVAKKEKADLNVVSAAALLHDIARCDELSGKCKAHEQYGAHKAKQMIKSLGLTPAQKQNVLHSIREHSSSTGKPESKEARIIADSDKLYGVITNPQRCISYSRIINRGFEDTLEYITEKIKRLTPKHFHIPAVRAVVKTELPLLKKRVRMFRMYWDRIK
jgi:HD superfamily phosphodiesterase